MTNLVSKLIMKKFDAKSIKFTIKMQDFDEKTINVGKNPKLVNEILEF